MFPDAAGIEIAMEVIELEVRARNTSTAPALYGRCIVTIRWSNLKATFIAIEPQANSLKTDDGWGPREYLFA
jgi:hypothetical protein